MSNSNNQQLIHDLIDGQLPDDQVQHVRQLMADDTELAALYQSLNEQQLALRSLPKYTLDDSFAERVLGAAQSQGLLSGKTETALKPSIATNSNGWWAPVAVIATLAAMLLVTLFVIPNMNSQSSVANLERSNSELDEVAADDERLDAPVKFAKEAAGKGGEKFSDVMEKSKAAPGAVVMDDSKSLDAPKMQQQLKNNSAGSEALKSEAKKKDSNRIQAQGEALAEGNDGIRQAPSNPATRNANPARMVQRTARQPEDAKPAVDPVELAAQSGPQVMVFNISKDEDNIRRINEMLTDNGIGVELPATLEERRRRIAKNENKQTSDPRTFAYHIQATPDQMQKAVLALNLQSDIVAIDSVDANAFGGRSKMGALQSPQQSDNQIAGGEPAGSQELQARKFTRQSNARAEELAENSVGAGRGGGAKGGAGFDSDSTTESKENSAAETESEADQALASAETIREINEYFRLETLDDKLARRSYTLIFMLKDGVVAAAAEPAFDAEAADTSQESDKLP